MDLIEQARRRVAVAREHGRAPVRWIANDAVAAELPEGDTLHGLPVERAETRWGLELVLA